MGVDVKDEDRKAIAANLALVSQQIALLEQQYHRTSRDKNRPLLQQKNPRKVLADLFAVREPLYREVADLVVETGRSKPRGVVETIVEYWNNPR